MTESGVVKNVTVTNSAFVGYTFTAAIVGYNFGTVTGCINEASVSGSTYSAGIAANNRGTVELCGNTGTIHAWAVSGGIVARSMSNGPAQAAVVKNCWNTGSISSEDSTAGGIAGENSALVSTYAFAEVRDCWSIGSVSAPEAVGGVTGDNWRARVSNCYSVMDPVGVLENGAYTDKAEQKTDAQFASGEVAYKLGEAWGQTVGTDNYPVFRTENNQVYQHTNCDGVTYFYTNNAIETITKHQEGAIAADRFDANGKCLACGTQAIASLTTADTTPVVTYYTTLEAAITAAQSAEGSTVMLLDDVKLSTSLSIPADCVLILDLNGKTISNAENVSFSRMIDVYGELTIGDSSANKDGKIVLSSGDSTSATVFTCNTLTVNNGTIANTAGGYAINAAIIGMAQSGTSAPVGFLVVENGVFVGGVTVWNENFSIRGGDFELLAIYDRAPDASMLGEGLTGGSFDRIVNGKPEEFTLADCLAKDVYAYGSDDKVITLADMTELTNITVKQGADLSKDAVITVSESEYNSSAQTPTVIVTVGGVQLEQGVDFNIQLDNAYDFTSAGDHAFSVIGTGNYRGTAEKTFTIDKATLTVSGATATSRVYDGTDSVTVTAVALDGKKGTDDVSIDVTNLTGTLLHRDCGSYNSITLPNLTLIGDDAENYTLTQPTGAVSTNDVTIDKAPLTVTADNKSMTTGRTLPTFTYTITGFVNGETEDVLTTKPTVNCGADGKTAGTYEITVSGAVADNYDITFVNGTLSVVDHQHVWTYTAQDNIITAICGNADTCPDAEQTIKIEAKGKIYDGTDVVATLIGSIDGVATPGISYSGNTNVGTYTASITIEGATANVNFEITKATISNITVTVTAPEAGAAPQTAVTAGEHYSATIEWNEKVDKFGFNTVYTATVILTADANYKFADSITVEGWSIENTGDALKLTKTFDATRKAKLTGITAPTSLTLPTYCINAEQAIAHLPTTVTFATELSDLSVEIEWSCANYDNTPSSAAAPVTNSFAWTVKAGQLDNYDVNGIATTENVFVTNADSIPVNHTGSNKETTYQGTTYDVSQMFTAGTTTGAVTYAITGGTGEGTLNGSILTITKAGTIEITMSTAANAPYLADSVTATLTVEKGTPTVQMPESVEGEFKGSANDIISSLPPTPVEGTWSWKDSNVAFDQLGEHTYTLIFTPTDPNYTPVEVEVTIVVTDDHIDANRDHLCDNGCGVSMGLCADANRDHACDYGCGRYYGSHRDSNKDHICDYGCYRTIGACVDKDMDHICDYGCGRTFKYLDENTDHLCDCGCQVIVKETECVDADKDHYCDHGCGKEFGEHVDTNKDHVCDYKCGERIGECVDEDRDHFCDHGCGRYKGKHADENGDHKCDYGCARVLSICKDRNKDHKCDLCGAEKGVCADKNKDHYCDYGCGKTFGKHNDGNKDHKCGYGCSTPIGEHKDEDEDGKCDHGCKDAVEK